MGELGREPLLCGSGTKRASGCASGAARLAALLSLLILSATAAAQTPGSVKWQFRPGEGHRATAAAIGQDGTIYYVITGYYSAGDWSKLIALAPDGTEKWRALLPALDPQRPPAIADDGTIYASDQDGISAFNPDGTMLWRWEGSLVGSNPWYHPAIGPDGTLYIRHSAVNPDGTTKWVLPAAFDNCNSPVIAADGTLYYVEPWEDVLHAVNPDGTLRWSLPMPLDVRSTPVIGLDGTIYIGDWTSPATFHAIHPDGTLKWSTGTSGRIGAGAVVGVDGTIYFGTLYTCNAYALNPDGTEKWVFNFWSTCNLESSPAIGKDGSILFVRSSHVSSVSSDGTHKWTNNYSADSFQTPTIDIDGTVYLPAYYSPRMTALHDDSGGLAPSAWPMYLQNVRHTARAETPIVPLTVGEPLTARLTPQGVAYFTLEATAGNALLIEVTPGPGVNSVVLSGQAGFSRFSSEDLTPRGTYELLIQPSVQTQYFFTVFGDAVDAAGGEFIISASYRSHHFSAFTPRAAGNAGEVRISLAGLGFAPGMQVAMNGPAALSPEEIILSSPTELMARFDLAGAALGDYDVTLTWPGVGSETLPDAFQILPGLGPHLEARLIAPEFIRPGRKFVLWLEYANSGDADMPAPLFTVRSNTLVSLDRDRLDSNRVEVLGIGDTADVEVLATGESRRIPIYFLGPGLGTTATFSLWITDGDGLAINWAAQKDLMQPPEMDPADWDALWPNLVARLGNTWGDYKAVLRADAAQLASYGGTAFDVSELIRLEMLHAAGDPAAAISGTLRHLDTLAPLVGVTVRARSPDGSIIRSTETATDPPGFFLLPYLPDGDYELWVDDYRFDPQEDVTVESGAAHGLELYAQDRPASQTEPEPIPLPHRNPTLASDGAGVLYAVWQVADSLWWAVNTGSGWDLTGIIPGATGRRPVAEWSAGLLEAGATPGLLVAWESTDSPRTLNWSIGEFTGTDMLWLDPQSLTGDAFPDSGIDLIVDDSSSPVVLWLQRDFLLEDDTDLYYTVLDLGASTLWLQPSARIPLAEAATTTICRAINFGQFVGVPKKIPGIGGSWGYSLAGSICTIEQQCAMQQQGSLQTKFDLGPALEIAGSAGATFEWKAADSKNCKMRWEFDKGTLQVAMSGTGKAPLLVIPFPLIAGHISLIPALSGSVGANMTWKSLPPGLPDEGGLSFSVAVVPTVEVEAMAGALKGTGSGSGEVYGGHYSPPRDPNDCILSRDHWCFEKWCLALSGQLDGLWGMFRLDWRKEWCDPDSNQPPSPITTSISDDSLAIVITRTDAEVPVSIFEEVLYTVDKHVGTGSSYEGLPVLGDISGDLFDDGLPALARSAAGEIVVIWGKDVEPQPGARLGADVVSSTFDGFGWTAPVTLSASTDFQKDPAVAFDSAGSPMALWSRASSAGLDYGDPGAALIPATLAAVEVADIVYSRRLAGAWSAPTPLATVPGRDEQPTVAAGPGGAMTAAWLNESDSGWTLYASFWNGSAWGAPTTVTTAALAERPVAAYGSLGPTLVWAQDTDGDPDTFDDWQVYSSFWDGSTWSVPGELAPTPDAGASASSRTADWISRAEAYFAPPPESCCSGGTITPALPPSGAQSGLGGGSSMSIAGFDPNEKAGPQGLGAGHYVSAGDRMDYTVYFENLASAPAPAQEVFVTDCLPSELDWTTLRLNEVAFGAVIVANTGDDFLFQQRVTIPDYRSGEAKTWWVDTEPDFNLVTGCLTVTFRTLDPDTGDLPTDPFAGFLPPEDGSGRGQGHIGFSIEAREDLADGTQIVNQASIVFDTNDAIVTNQVLNTVGIPPTTFTLTLDHSGSGSGSISSAPPGITCGSDCEEAFSAGTVVTLTPQAGGDSVFHSWSGDPDCLDGMVTMNSDLACTARFELHDIFSDGFESGNASAWSITVP